MPGSPGQYVRHNPRENMTKKKSQKNLTYWLTEARKATAGAALVATALASSGLIDGGVAKTIAGVVAFLVSAKIIHEVPNETTS